MQQEKDYRELYRLSRELGIPVPETFLEIVITGEGGRGRRLKTIRRRSHSWNRNAYNLLFCQLACADASDSSFGAGYLSIKLQSGALAGSLLGFQLNTFYYIPINYYLSDLESSGRGYIGSDEQDSRSIQIGTGLTAENFDGYTLQTKIANGHGTGQVNYVRSVAAALTYDSLTKILTVTHARYFNNNSGGDIALAEIGLTADWLMCRDVLSPAVNYPDKAQLKVTYAISLTFPY